MTNHYNYDSNKSTLIYTNQQKISYPFYTKEQWGYITGDINITLYRKYLPDHVVSVEFNNGKIVDTNIDNFKIGILPFKLDNEVIIDRKEFDEHNEWNVE